MAVDEEAANGLTADTLTVKVGYFGGPYYEKHVFTLDELWAMDVVRADYTFIDSMPAVVIDHVAGVRLTDLLDAAGIDLNSVQTFYFWTRDKQSDYYTSYPKSELIDTPRYCYYSLPDNFDEDAGAGNEYAALDAQPVDTLISLADNWERCIAGATFGSDYLNLDTTTRFRLIFGQTDTVTQTASRSAKWVHEIVVELGGAPTLTLDDSALEGKVGSVLRTEAHLTAADPAILAGGSVSWSSSDEQVATVDENGNITVKGEGSAVMTASFEGASATVAVNGTPGETESAAPVGAQPPEAGASGTKTAQTDTSGAQPPQTEASAPSRPGPEKESTARTLTPLNKDADSVLPQPKTEQTGKKGGVQNWRELKMSADAHELPEIKTENRELMRKTGLLAAGLLLLSIVLRVVQYYIEIGGKSHGH